MNIKQNPFKDKLQIDRDYEQGKLQAQKDILEICLTMWKRGRLSGFQFEELKQKIQALQKQRSKIE